MRWMMSVMALMALTCGCTRQEQAQQQLITQLQSGLQEFGQHSDGRQQIISESYQQRRALLDDAFDEDVRRTEGLDAPWVIEHRRAYAAGMEAIWRAQQASEMSHRQAMENLQAVSEGLERLRWISEMRENWAKTFGQISEEVRDESR